MTVNRIACALLLLVATSALSGPLLQKSNLVYKGSFSVPPSATCVGGTMSMYAAGGGGMAMNKVSGNSLFIGGHPYDYCYAEISIPASCQTGTQSCSGTASYVQPLRDAGLTGSIGGDGTVRSGGVYVYNGHMYNTLYTYYSNSFPSQSSSHFRRPLSLSSAKEAGPVNLGGAPDPAFQSGYMGDVSPAWQAAFGGPSLTGQCCLAVVSRTSHGPAAFAWNPESMGSPAAIPLLYYQYPDHATLGTQCSNCTQPAFNGSTLISAVFMPLGTDTVAFYGQTGTGINCYKEECPPIGVEDTGGWSNQRHEHYFWLYNAADLAAVKAGTKQPWEPVPYSQFTLSDTIGDATLFWNVGAAYNPTTAMVYIGQFCPNWPSVCEPIIAAYHIEGIGASSYTVTPSAGANGTISPNTAQTVNSGSTTAFTVTPNSGYTASVGGTCGGSLVGTTYTTNAITGNCTVSATFADTVAPALSGFGPASPLAANTTSTTLALTTDEAATCRYSSSPGAAFGAMTAFPTTGNTSHSASVATAKGRTDWYYIRCQDGSGNLSAQAVHRLSVSDSPKRRGSH